MTRKPKSTGKLCVPINLKYGRIYHYFYSSRLLSFFFKYSRMIQQLVVYGTGTGCYQMVEPASKCLQYEARDRPGIKLIFTEVEPFQTQTEVSSHFLIRLPNNTAVSPTMLSPLGKLSFQEWIQEVQDMLSTKRFGDIAFRDKDFKAAIEHYSKS